jgi:hypothetical protein
MEKQIKLYKNYQPHITNIEDEKQKTEEMIQNIYSLCINESNQNNRDYALSSLPEEYKYVSNKYSIVPGSYLRYIDTTNYKNMKLKLGGFVIHDNGHSLVYKNDNRFVKLNKKHCVLFVHITYNEKLRCAIE